MLENRAHIQGMHISHAPVSILIFFQDFIFLYSLCIFVTSAKTCVVHRNETEKNLFVSAETIEIEQDTRRNYLPLTSPLTPWNPNFTLVSLFDFWFPYEEEKKQQYF